MCKNGKRFLVVDDDPLMLKMLSDCLKLATNHCFIDTIHNAKQALDLLEERTYDVLVTDYMMPGMSGLSLIRRARQIDPSLRIILVTALSMPIISREVSGLDDLCMIRKPFNYEDIARAVSSWDTS
jgi:CheY-like chemotaxis protein